MTAEELAGLAAEPEDVADILEREMERLLEQRALDREDVWGWSD